ncbi:MAG: hypothetical protein AB8B56_09955 [Crocinitomicaceae bacterium]
MSQNKRNTTELNSAQSVIGETELKILVELKEVNGIVEIRWEIDHRYPIPKMKGEIQALGINEVYECSINAHIGAANSHFPWGNDYVGSLWGWNGEKYILIVQTPITS